MSKTRKSYRNTRRKQSRNHTSQTVSHKDGWQYVSKWYDGMVGEHGSKFHKHAIPTILDLLNLHEGDSVLDVGCGQGILAPHIAEKNAHYTGIDISSNMIDLAKKQHYRNHQKSNSSKEQIFLTGDITTLKSNKHFDNESFDAAAFLFSIQDIRWYKKAIASASWILKPEGRCVIYMTHPAFRIPRQSGWGYDKQRKLIYRRLDSYLSRLDVPLRTHRKTQKTLTRSYHRPIGDYIHALTHKSFVIDQFMEIPAPIKSLSKTDTNINKAERRALEEFPLFLAIRAIKQVK